MTSFPCTGCGACCRQVGAVLARFRTHPEAFGAIEREALAVFPFAIRPDGACEQLGEDGRCGVYAIRPLVCRVDMMGMARGWSREETWRVAAAACDVLQFAAQMPEAVRVRLPRYPEDASREAFGSRGDDTSRELEQIARLEAGGSDVLTAEDE